jgi:hypothetical protein
MELEEIKDVIELCKGRKRIKGSLKEGCILDDKVILWAMNPKGDSELYDEYNMIKELEKYGLPVVNIYDMQSVKVNKRVSVALVEELLTGDLFKPHDKPKKMNDSIKKQIEDIYNILKKNKILIEDLQWIYNKRELKIIDPFKIYLLDDKKKKYTILGAEQDKRPISYNRLEKKFNEQLDNLEVLLSM